MAEVAIPRQMFPGDSAAHRGTAAAATTSASVRMSGKIARSDPRPPCGLREVLVAVRTSRLPALQGARKSR
jgi:hypothetical protein